MAKSRARMPLLSKRTSSFSVQLTDWTMPPSICADSPSGLMISPESTAAQARGTRTTPLARSTSTSATTAT